MKNKKFIEIISNFDFNKSGFNVYVSAIFSNTEETDNGNCHWHLNESEYKYFVKEVNALYKKEEIIEFQSIDEYVDENKELTYKDFYKKWKDYGFLEGLTNKKLTKTVCFNFSKLLGFTLYMEKNAKSFKDNVNDLTSISTIAFPLLRRIVAKYKKPVIINPVHLILTYLYAQNNETILKHIESLKEKYASYIDVESELCVLIAEYYVYYLRKQDKSLFKIK